MRLLGRPRLEGTAASPRGRKTWALLARIALAERPLTRLELAADLFPAAADPLAALRWTLADLRRALTRPELLRGDRVHLTRADLWLDVHALQDGTLPPDETGGLLLEGADLRDCPAFDTWLLLTRAHLAARTREELRRHTLQRLAVGHHAEAADLAARAARLDPLDEGAQELLLRALVAAGRPGVAADHLRACETTFRSEGLDVSPSLRAAATPRPTAGLRAGVAAQALLTAGRAALDAGAADAGIETLRRAAEDAERAADPALQAEVLLALGAALVHAVRGFDGEGAVVLSQALVRARTAARPLTAAEILRELAFTDVQAGRHTSAARALAEATQEAGPLDEPALTAGLLAVQGMNEADRGRHHAATGLLTRSARLAAGAGRPRQQAWSLGVLARSHLLAGDAVAARESAQASLDLARRHRWAAFRPWPQAIHAECQVLAGDWDGARADAEEAFALGCELADPCWEGMAGRALGLVAAGSGDDDAAWHWLLDARQRSDRVPDRYVWVSAYIGLAQLELARRADPSLAPTLAGRLLDDALRADLPEFRAWALVHQGELGSAEAVSALRTASGPTDNPGLRARIDSLTGRTPE